MDCQKPHIAEKLVPFVEGALAEADRREVLDHLPQCSLCSQEAKSLRQVVGLLRETAGRSLNFYPAAMLSPEDVIDYALDAEKMSESSRRRVQLQLVESLDAQQEVEWLRELEQELAQKEDLIRVPPFPAALRSAVEGTYGAPSTAKAQAFSAVVAAWARRLGPRPLAAGLVGVLFVGFSVHAAFHSQTRSAPPSVGSVAVVSSASTAPSGTPQPHATATPGGVAKGKEQVALMPEKVLPEDLTRLSSLLWAKKINHNYRDGQIFVAAEDFKEALDALNTNEGRLVAHSELKAGKVEANSVREGAAAGGRPGFEASVKDDGRPVALGEQSRKAAAPETAGGKRSGDPVPAAPPPAVPRVETTAPVGHSARPHVGPSARPPVAYQPPPPTRPGETRLGSKGVLPSYSAGPAVDKKPEQRPSPRVDEPSKAKAEAAKPVPPRPMATSRIVAKGDSHPSEPVSKSTVKPAPNTNRREVALATPTPEPTRFAPRQQQAIPVVNRVQQSEVARKEPVIVPEPKEVAVAPGSGPVSNVATQALRKGGDAEEEAPAPKPRQEHALPAADNQPAPAPARPPLQPSQTLVRRNTNLDADGLKPMPKWSERDRSGGAKETVHSQDAKKDAASSDERYKQQAEGSAGHRSAGNAGGIVVGSTQAQSSAPAAAGRGATRAGVVSAGSLSGESPSTEVAMLTQAKKLIVESIGGEAEVNIERRDDGSLMVTVKPQRALSQVETEQLRKTLRKKLHLDDADSVVIRQP